MITRGLLAAVFATMSWSALAAAVMPTNASALGSISVDVTKHGHGDQLVDGNAFTQLDFQGWAALVWADGPRTIDRVIVEQCPNYVIANYDIQIAKAGVNSPDPANDEHWETVQAFRDMSGGSAPVFSFDNRTTSGVRFLAIPNNVIDPDLYEESDPAGAHYGAFDVGRLRNIWAYENYFGNNLSLEATFSAPGWTGVGEFNDGSVVSQTHTGNLATSPDVFATFTDAVELGGCYIVGGSGAVSEHLIDYDLLYRDLDTGLWEVALSVRGNDQKSLFSEFTAPAAAEWCLHIYDADYSNGSARVSEIMLLAAIPEPATMTLLTLGGLTLLRRRR